MAVIVFPAYLFHFSSQYLSKTFFWLHFRNYSSCSQTSRPSQQKQQDEGIYRAQNEIKFHTHRLHRSVSRSNVWCAWKYNKLRLMNWKPGILRSIYSKIKLHLRNTGMATSSKLNIHVYRPFSLSLFIQSKYSSMVWRYLTVIISSNPKWVPMHLYASVQSDSTLV